MWHQHDCQHHNRNHHHNRWHHRSRHPSLQSLHLCQGDIIRIITIITNNIMPGCPRIWAGGHISIGSSSTWRRQRPRSQPISAKIQRLTIRMSSLGGLYFIIYLGLFFIISSGLFFVMPCIDSYQKVDLRTVSFDVPPQEVSHWYVLFFFNFTVTWCLVTRMIYQCCFCWYRSHISSSARPLICCWNTRMIDPYHSC